MSGQDGGARVENHPGAAVCDPPHDRGRHHRTAREDGPAPSSPRHGGRHPDRRGGAGARKFLAQEGRDGRIASTVWIVAEGEIAESFRIAATSGGRVEAELTSAAQLRLTANHSGGSRGQTSIILEEDTTFAYLMHRVAKWNKDKTRIEELDLDSKGLG
jgi:hypothetical protein